MNTTKKIISVFVAVLLILCAGCFPVYAEEVSWTCPGCGETNTTNFCTQCGTRKPETITCPVCGENYPADTTANYCGNCGTKLQEVANHSFRLEGNGFDTPEEAVTYYLKGIRYSVAVGTASARLKVRLKLLKTFRGLTLRVSRC